MAFFVSSGFAPPCGSGCWLCATCHIGVATTGSVRRFSLRCQLVSGWRWYCSHMTFSWSFHQTNLAWKGLLEHFHFYTRILQYIYYFKSCCSWLICFFCFGNGAFWSCFVEMHLSGQHPPVDPGCILASPPLRLLVSELACAHRGHPYSLPGATEPLHRSAAGTGASGGRCEGRWQRFKMVCLDMFFWGSQEIFPQFGVKHHIQNSGWRVFCSNKRWHWWRKPGWDPGKVIYNIIIHYITYSLAWTHIHR